MLVTDAKGLRWSGTGFYDYQIGFRVTNTDSNPIYYSVAATFYGPNGESLSSRAHTDPFAPRVIAANSTVPQNYPFTDSNLTNPWAERVTLRISFGNKSVSGEAPVSHGPPIARLYEFGVSPLQLSVGQTVTVKWNVGSATRVRLSRWMVDPADPSGPTSVDVESAGSRTVVAQSPGRTGVDLYVDDWGRLLRDRQCRAFRVQGPDAFIELN
jgi:hypothetical protein